MKKTVKVEDIIDIIKEKVVSNGKAAFTVKGSSMFPFFYDELTVVTIMKPNFDLKVTDVILYKTS